MEFDIGSRRQHTKEQSVKIFNAAENKCDCYSFGKIGSFLLLWW